MKSKPIPPRTESPFISATSPNASAPTKPCANPKGALSGSRASSTQRLSSITDFAYIFDKEGRFVYSNQPLLGLLGITLAEITGKDFHDFNYPPDLAARLQSQIRQVFSAGEIVKDETPFTATNSAKGFYEYIFSPVKTADGTVESVAGSTRDITTRKLAETNLALLAEISQDLAELTTIDEIMKTVGAKIGAFLNLSICAFLEINETADEAALNYSWQRADTRDVKGVYRLSEYLNEEFQRAGRAGEIFIVNDTNTDARSRFGLSDVCAETRRTRRIDRCRS